MYSAYLYLSMSAYLADQNWPGMAKWMTAQGGEENSHAMKIFNYIVERGGRVTLAAIDAPKTDWSGPAEVFEEAYGHEQKVTAMIHELVKLAREENDYASEVMLQWFVKEQVEEEASADEIVQALKKIGESSNGMFMLDHQLGKRE
jgi:ferritin